MTDTTTIISELLRKTVAAYTHNPDLIEVGAQGLGQIIILNLQAEKSDHRKLVGKGGRAIRALKEMFTAIGKAQGLEIRIELLEPKDITREPTAGPFDQALEWPGKDATVEVIAELVAPVAGEFPHVTAKNSKGATAFSILVPAAAYGEVSAALAALRVIVELVGNKNRRLLAVEATAA